MPFETECILAGSELAEARIVGKLALENQKLTGPLTLFRCWVPEGISLYYAECTYVDFRGCTTGSIDARRLIVKGDILFSDSFVGVGGINLSGAEIGGDLQCQGAWFINPGGVAMLADSIKVGRNLRLGSPSADDATVLDKQSHFRADGEICLDGAIVGEQLDCFAGHFRNRGAVALSANAAEIGGDVQLSGSFCSLGEVHFVGCEVGGQFDCEGGHFLNHRDTALTLNGARIHRDVILRDGFRAYGEVNLLGVEIDGDIDCSRASFFGAGRTALMAAGASIKQRLLLRRDFRATGEVNIDGARVGADLDCSNGNFFQSSTFALSAVATTITGSASLESVEAKGLLVLRRAKIGGDLSLAGARFTGDQPNGLDARTAEIGGTLTWKTIDSNASTILKMRDCKVGILADDAASWLDRDRMTLDGFEYGCIAEDSPNDAALREQWLSMQKEPQTPQPYIQAAKVFRASGRDADATAILVAKEEALLEHGKLGQAERCWMHLMDWTVRFGYTPLRALKGTAFFVFLGSILFGFGYRKE